MLWNVSLSILCLALACFCQDVRAADVGCQGLQPRTTWWSASNKEIPHITWAGRETILKAVVACAAPGDDLEYQWDYGDGEKSPWSRVQNPFAIEVRHQYATLTPRPLRVAIHLRRKGNAKVASDSFPLQVVERSLAVEAKCAIDDGLWYLHQTQRRVVENGVSVGDWIQGDGKASGFIVAITASNLAAFETNGHVASGDPRNPYTETVKLGLRRLFGKVKLTQIQDKQTNGLGTFSSDSNGNGLGLAVDQDYPLYQGAMVLQAVMASGTPDAKVDLPPTGTDGKPTLGGKPYSELAQDIVDYYAFCQYDGPTGGGWRYYCNQAPDNSASRWAATGLLAAGQLKEWKLKVPKSVIEWSKVWLKSSQGANGVYGYEGKETAWGPYATTPSAMVQLAMAGIGRGNPQWDKAESFLRDNFANTGGPSESLKAYYYGLFALVKALLLHDSSGDGVAEPLADLRSSTPDTKSIDWYWIEASRGDVTDGVARVLVRDQNPFGYWSEKDFDPRQFAFETSQAIMMLNRCLLHPGAPQAVAAGPAGTLDAGVPSRISAAGSYHQNPKRKIVRYGWRINDEAEETTTTPQFSYTFSKAGTHRVRLIVTDDAGLSADTLVHLSVKEPK